MTTLQEGDKAPDFTAVNQDGKTVSLSDYAGKKLLLYFYPKDHTPGCTMQACDLRDNFSSLSQAGYEILGVSPDQMKTHQSFIAKHKLPFALLADTDHKVAEAYGVYGSKKFMGRTYQGIHRTTFLIDGKGVIERVITQVKTREHSKQIL